MHRGRDAAHGHEAATPRQRCTHSGKGLCVSSESEAGVGPGPGSAAPWGATRAARPPNPRSNVPRGRWPALRAASSTRQLEKRTVGLFRNCSSAPNTDSESSIVRSLCCSSISTAVANCSASSSYTDPKTKTVSIRTSCETQAPLATNASATATCSSSSLSPDVRGRSCQRRACRLAMCRRIPSFKASRLRGAGGVAKSARWTSSKEYRPARRTTILSSSSSHSRTDPGPMPSFRRTSAGTEICPWAVTFECAIATAGTGTGARQRTPSGDQASRKAAVRPRRLSET